MRVTSFQAMAHKYAATLGGSNKVFVTFGGEQAYTDGKRVNLPAMPAGTFLTAWQAQYYGGYLDHEVGHVRYTSFDEWKRHKAEMEKSSTFHYIFNVVEDVRIENCQIKDYKGSRKFLDALCEEVDNKAPKDPTAITPEKKLLSLFHKEVWKYRSVDLFRIPGELGDIKEMAEVVTLLKEVPDLESTKESYKLSKKLAKILPDDKSMTPQQMNMAGMEELLSIIGQALAEAAGEMLEETDRGKAMSSRIKEISVGNNGKPGNATQPQNHEPMRNGDRIIPPVSTHLDEIFVERGSNIPRYDQERAEVEKEIASLKKMLAIYLRSRTQRAFNRGLEEGSLDLDRLHHLFLGSARVMKTKRNRQIVDTVVEVMVDNSGSMDAYLTRQAVAMAAEAVEGVGQVRMSIDGFTTKDDDLQGKGGRSCPIIIRNYKGFDEPLRKARGRIGAMRTHGYTPLGEAYGYGLEKVGTQKESRKVLWIITDGSPYFPTQDSNHSEKKLMEKVYETAKAMGVETLCIDIGGRGRMKGLVDHEASASNIQDLATVMLEKLKEAVR